MPLSPAVTAAVRRLIRQRKKLPDKAAAVFDFDDTAIIGDIGEQALRRQIDDLVFALTPDHFASLLPLRPNGVEFLDQAWGGARIADVRADLMSHYWRIHEAYEGLAGRRPLARIAALPEYEDFVVKLNLLFDGLIDTAGVGKAYVYPWTARFFAGLRPVAVQRLALWTWAAESVGPLGERELRSPKKLKTKAGPQRMTIRTGVRYVPEMRELFAQLQAARIDVYVVTASLEEVVAPVATAVYGLPRERVFGMRAIVSDGRFSDVVETRGGYAVTYGAGKTTVIRNRIDAEPVLVAGDSETDLDMLTAFPETRVRLVIDRGKTGAIADLYEQGRRGVNGVVLQSRDDRAGVFVG